MSLENIILVGDNQDLGSNLNAIASEKSLATYLKDNFDPSDTWILNQGDFLDEHASGNMHYGDLTDENIKIVSDDEVKDILSQKGIPLEEFSKITRKELLNIKRKLANSSYFHNIMAVYKDLVDTGFKYRAVLGNNECPVLFGREQLSLETYPQMADTFRDFVQKFSGIEYIDDCNLREEEGLKIISTPNWAVNYGEGKQLALLHEGQTPEESKLYQELTKANLNYGDQLLLFCHDTPKNYNLPGGKYLEETKGTIFVSHGHSGKPGVSYEKNSNGGEIITINSNASPNGGINPFRTFYTLKVKDGTILGVNEFEISANNS